MKKYVVLVLSALFSLSVTLPPSVTKQYRTDYTYNKKTDAFYKLHTEIGSGPFVNSNCELEGAQLMVPTSHEDIVQAHAMLKQFPDIGDYLWIGADGQEHESADEQPIIDLSSLEWATSSPFPYKQCYTLRRTGEIEFAPCYLNTPFICKVEAKDAPYDELCGVYGTNYTYEASVGSCYKIPALQFTWNQAYAECRHEGAHLVVINSEAEHLVIRRLLVTAPRPEYADFRYFFAGFRAEEPNRVFKTIFNQTLEEAGFSQWSPNEPNNRWGEEYCGSINKSDGKFNDIDCSRLFLFICEKEVAL